MKPGDGDLPYSEALTKEKRDRLSPEDILAMMRDGNERFARGRRKPRNYLAEQKASTNAQYPAAVILSCIDSRAPAEVIMDLGIGDIFNARVAGNVANPDILGSMEFACKVAGAKVALVLGHTACGAVRGCIEGVQLGHLTGLLARIQPAVAATRFEGERSAENPAYVEAVARRNVELTMAHIREQSTVLRQLEAEHALTIVGAMYNLSTARLEFL